MARKPNHKELDLYDYSGVVSGKIKVQTNAQDKVGRYIEQVIAELTGRTNVMVEVEAATNVSEVTT